MAKLKMKWGNAVGDSLSFALSPKAFGPFFVLDAVLGLIAIFYAITSILPYISSRIASATVMGSEAAIGEAFLSAISQFFGLLIVWFVGNLVLQSFVMEMRFKKAENYKKTWKSAKNIILPFILTAIAVSAFSFVAGFADILGIPFIGTILSIIVSWAFFFALPAVVVERKGVGYSLRSSVNIFKSRTLETLISWIIVSIISTLIIIASLIPSGTIIILSFPFLISAIGSGQSAWSAFPILLISGIIFLIGFSISRAFSVGVLVDLYKQIRVKK